MFKAGDTAATRRAVTWALEAGYRHLDTAEIYRNERAVGDAIKASRIPRRDLFVTTKLWRESYDEVRSAFDASMDRLGLDYVDMYLLHWPTPKKRLGAWRALQAIQRDGRCHSIGVSNFTTSHLQELLDAGGQAPELNQVELHPFLQQKELVAFCTAHGIALEAWAPLTKRLRLQEPELLGIAKQLERTPAQILLRWSLQKGFIVIPKSSNQDRIRENRDLYDFELSADLMARLDHLEEGFRSAPGWDPSTVT